MNDNLEKYIKENKSEFDDLTPNRHVWKHIELSLDHAGQRKAWIKNVMKIAAAFITILGVGVIIGWYVGRSDFNKNNLATSPKMLELKSVEENYVKQLNVKLNTIEDKTSKISVEKELNDLDIIYEELRTELRQAENSNLDVLIDAMIKNNKTKAEMLEFILQKQKLNKNEIEKLSI
jgi:hypothetical protein